MKPRQNTGNSLFHSFHDKTHKRRRRRRRREWEGGTPSLILNCPLFLRVLSASEREIHIIFCCAGRPFALISTLVSTTFNSEWDNVRMDTLWSSIRLENKTNIANLWVLKVLKTSTQKSCWTPVGASQNPLTIYFPECMCCNEVV